MSCPGVSLQDELSLESPQGLLWAQPLCHGSVPLQGTILSAGAGWTHDHTPCHVPASISWHDGQVRVTGGEPEREGGLH